MTTSSKQSWLRRTAAAAVMGVSLVCAGGAGAQTPVKETCPGTQATQVESKVCPNGAVTKRACCTKTTEKGTKTRCKSFPKCPRQSPS